MAVFRSKLFAFFVRAISAVVTYVVDISVALDLFNIPCVGSFVGYVEDTKTRVWLTIYEGQK